MIVQTEFGKIKPSNFKPSIALTNSHLQTIWPKFGLKSPINNFVRERIKTPDNDFLDLDWKLPKKQQALVVLFHGLEGSSRSHYIEHLVEVLYKNDIGSVTMHFRGCSGQSNLTSISYHSGATFDPEYIIPLVKQRYASIPLFAIGFSLGGNMLMKLAANNASLPIEAFACISAPLNLAASSEAINIGFSKVYQNHLMTSMKTNVINKMKTVDMGGKLKLSENEIQQLKTFNQFDEHITAPLHGFKGADDYYLKCSAINDLGAITKPTLIIHALDDPFMDARVIPRAEQINQNVAYEFSQFGGHVGFLNSITGQSKLWLPQRLLSFVLEQLPKEARNDCTV